MQVSPLNDLVCLRMKPRAVEVAAGIIGVSALSDRIPSNEGEVVAVGPGRRTKRGVVPMSVEVGQCVMVSSPGPSSPVDGVWIDERERLWMVPESAIIGVVG